MLVSRVLIRTKWLDIWTRRHFLKRKSKVLSIQNFILSFYFFLLFFFLPVVSTPGSRYYADVAGIRVPILSSVSLTSESSASVRSSKGKLQLGDVSPIERTQTNRTRIVIGGVMSGCAASAIIDDKNLIVIAVIRRGRQTCVCVIVSKNRVLVRARVEVEAREKRFSKRFFSKSVPLSEQSNVNLVDSFGRWR